MIESFVCFVCCDEDVFGVIDFVGDGVGFGFEVVESFCEYFFVFDGEVEEM